MVPACLRLVLLPSIYCAPLHVLALVIAMASESYTTPVKRCFRGGWWELLMTMFSLSFGGVFLLILINIYDDWWMCVYSLSTKSIPLLADVQSDLCILWFRWNKMLPSVCSGYLFFWSWRFGVNHFFPEIIESTFGHLSRFEIISQSGNLSTSISWSLSRKTISLYSLASCWKHQL